MTITSGGNIKISADNLIAENVAITAAGKSNIRVHASTTLSVTTAGYSEVKYAGNPKISKSTFGAASIQKITK
ncbi:MAG: DUF2807 domain-containing protein [Coxiellaceae bacterium]|nr:MAG: DUF2807 domain-containing protein [Coxiellaceae bacterium]